MDKLQDLNQAPNFFSIKSPIDSWYETSTLISYKLYSYLSSILFLRL